MNEAAPDRQHADTLLPPILVNKAREVIEANRAAGRKIAVAESCTGGLVGAALTEVPGSSDVFEASFVTYSNEAKVKLVSVALDVIETFGAVSIATAWAMAQGTLQRADVDVAVAITGIAGPEGGSEKKPVGTVVFARAERDAPPSFTGRAPWVLRASAAQGVRGARRPTKSRPNAANSAIWAGVGFAFRQRCARLSC
jgi:nicotinamide-nucleotide amidase